ncbi:MAG: hypothetical protein ACXAC2_00565, partial [Candidatus Kariarchaeaceae archaeon]
MLDTIFGTDPELFVVDSENNCIPPAALREDYGLNYKDVLFEGDNFTIVEDGAASEINITPTNDIETFNRRIKRGFELFRKSILDNYDGLDVVAIPTVNFDPKKYWENRGEDFRDCVRFGCDPDLDVRTGEYCQEINAENYDKRHGGGHIHISAPENDANFFEENFFYTTLMLDFLVGNTCVAIERNSSEIDDLEKDRLIYYGRPSRIRLPVYPNGVKGIEYRSPSNFWVTNEDHSNIVLTMANCVFNLM